ncbi:hypothetical protein [Adhaeribacter pallidiroseus]|uniref:Outer membrane protein beta-barrel domain-containing protein n=1 Tax=Adhaeribacter pallidiroseus TaxID=2072847 RepID=A0A369QSM1_9BACT|nr:hypothetical protein [Adhaeribacter pallidiroseus]RDC65819.1 hypothetical protein AHMF7616_04449 [Adhaeribacter pallidiroseus]
MKQLCMLALVAITGFCINVKAQAQDLKLSKLTFAYKRSSFHFLDKQASPNIYQANLNGVSIGYEHAGIKSRSFVNLQANTGTALPKGLGAREYTFTSANIYGETTSSQFVHAPTLYIGQIEAGYLRKLRTGGNKEIFAGITLQEWLGYSDNIGMWSTWANNFATLNATIQYEKKLNTKQQLQFKAAIPVLAVVSRMPYSNVISDPTHSNFHAFFDEGTELNFPDKFQKFSFGATYQYRLGRHWQAGVAYDFQWLHAPEPQSIKAYSHTANLQINHLF